MTTLKRLLTLEEGAEYLGRTVGAVREMVYSGKLTPVKIDRRVQLDIKDLEKLIEDNKVHYEI